MQVRLACSMEDKMVQIKHMVYRGKKAKYSEVKKINKWKVK